MRFLLKATRPSIRQVRIPGRGTKSLQPKKKTNNTNNGIQQSSNTVKAWGQRCSPNCGCTIRFEISLDPSTNQILSAAYEAKTIVTKIHTSNNKYGGTTIPESTFLQPLLTQSRNPSDPGRPLMKSCKCDTLHGLATTITEMLPTISLSQAQNQLEYTGNRSSPAFRYTALKHLNLLNTNFNSKGTRTHARKCTMNTPFDINAISEGQCWDLVEEALTACIQGHIPKPRPTAQLQNAGNYDARSEATQRTTRIDNEDREGRDLDPLRFVRAAKRRAKEELMQTLQPPHSFSASISTSSPTSSMPPFHLLSEPIYAHGDTLTQLKLELKAIQGNEGTEYVTVNDWVSYVDEKQNKCSSISE